MGKSNEQTVGYKYLLGMHMILCHGPIDKLVQIKVDGKVAAMPNSTGGSIDVDAEGLFGGEEKEGGVSGTVDFEQGRPSQVANSYLSSQLTDVPGFRGVAALVLRQCYMGMNPYLKRWSALGTRIHVRQNDVTQWYDAKAEIGNGNLTSSSGPLPPGVGLISSTSGQGSPIVMPTIDGDRIRVGDGLLMYIRGSNSNALSWATPGWATLVTARVLSGGSPYVAVWQRTATGTSADDEGVFTVDPSHPINEGWILLVIRGVTNAGTWAHQGLRHTYTNEPVTIPLIEANRQLVIRMGATLSTIIGDGSASLGAPPAGTEGINIKENIHVDPYPSDIPSEVALCWKTTSDLTNYIDEISYSGDFGGGGSLASLMVVAFGPSSIAAVELPDMNPAHIIRECLTDPNWGMGYNESDVDDTSFTYAADYLYAEGFGLSMVWNSQVPIEDFIKEVLKTIDASLYVSRITGQFVLKLIRDDYDVGSLTTFDESNVSKVDDYSIKGFQDLYNSLTVKYVDNSTSNDASIEVQDIAQVQMQGAIVGTTVTYAGISNGPVAARVAARDLKVLSSALITCSISTRGPEAQSLNVGDVFLFSWALYDVQNVVMRVAKISYGDGTDNAVKIQAVQDVFGMPLTYYTTVDPSEWSDISVTPVPTTDQIAFELPYYILARSAGTSDTNAELVDEPDLGFVGGAAGRPTGMINAQFTTLDGSYKERGVFDFCATAVASAMTKLTTTVSISSGVRLTLADAGSFVQIDDEILVVVSVSDTTLICERGALDTVPEEHADGSILYFWDRYYGSDKTQYVAAEVISAKILPISGEGQCNALDATRLDVTLNSRAIRPYPPGNFKIADEYFPEVVSDTFAITWAHRDRLLQTSPTLMSFLDGPIGPEAGTTYSIRVYDDDTGILLDSITGETGTSWTPVVTDTYRIRVELESVRDAYVSWQMQNWTFDFIGEDARMSEDGDPRISENRVLRGLE